MQFQLFVSYAQVAVFPANLANPFNDWKSQHIDQGFAWREKSVSFATLDESGAIKCEAIQSTDWKLGSNSKRAIRVPFRCPDSEVEVSTISDSALVTVGDAGWYALIYETWLDEASGMHARFTFIPTDVRVDPAILLADASLRPPSLLVMSADSA